MAILTIKVEPKLHMVQYSDGSKRFYSHSTTEYQSKDGQTLKKRVRGWDSLYSSVNMRPNYPMPALSVETKGMCYGTIARDTVCVTLVSSAERNPALLFHDIGYFGSPRNELQARGQTVQVFASGVDQYLTLPKWED